MKKIKAGRYYRDWNGNPVYILSTKGSDANFSVIGVLIKPQGVLTRKAYTPEGKYLSWHDSNDDLKGPWPKFKKRPSLTRTQIKDLKNKDFWVW